jgi:high-affinity iron transporter
VPAGYLTATREGLQAALVVAVVTAVLVRCGRRGLLPAVGAGVGVAVAVSLAYGAVLTFGPGGMTQQAQEAMSGVLCVVAAGFLTATVRWTARSGRRLPAGLGTATRTEELADLPVVVLVAMLAVGRVGLGAALDLWAAGRAAATTPFALLGPVLGLLTAAGAGYLLHRGALRVGGAGFFAWTGTILVVLTAGVLSYGVRELQAGGLLPGLTSVVVDLRSVLGQDTWAGSLLEGTVDLTPDLTWLQAVAWAVYVAVALPAFLLAIRRSAGPAPARDLLSPR